MKTSALPTQTPAQARVPRHRGEHREIKPNGLCVNCYAAPGTLFHHMYCSACYCKLRRGGGENLHPVRTWVPAGKRVGHWRVIWRCGDPDLLYAKDTRPDDRERCSVGDCDNLARHKHVCPKHDPVIQARYVAEKQKQLERERAERAAHPTPRRPVTRIKPEQEIAA